MRIDWDVPIRMDDGLVLRCDAYRPDAKGKCPAILNYGPYAKWLHLKDGYPAQWKVMTEKYPETVQGTSNLYQNWEVADPEKWVPDGYACVRVDSRGAGRSPGFMEVFSPREAKDLYNCIEWAARQPWCSGKVGLNGISYYAMNQWQVASLQPPHLAAMCVWEGAADFYRDLSHHGGIYNIFADMWYRDTVTLRQHGRGNRDFRSRINGEWTSGPETLPEEVLAANRCDYGKDLLDHPLIDDYWKARMPDYSKISVPLLSAGNWGGVGLHPRGNFEGFLRAAAKQKWLEVHGLDHFTHFYTDYGVALQKKFFGHFLKGEKTGWEKRPRVTLQVRHPGEKFVERAENEWPLARTKWTKFHLNLADLTLSARKAGGAGKAAYEAMGDGLLFLTPPLKEETEITGPAAAKLFISSETRDADLFLVLRVFTPDMKEITFQGSNDPHTAVGHGWLRASHRKLDPEKSLPYRPYHTHDEKQPLKPGQVYELDVEIWPTSIVVPKGYRIGLAVRGRDYVYPGFEQPPMPVSGRIYSGVGPFRHDNRRDRPLDVFGGKVTLHAGPGRQPYLLLPIIPAR
ncbi:MAG: peptidase S15 [Candidatus Tectomicrobia bacterium RIFCSPLOWO2_12_FULL_69_37]|nr:MAG: peptidase S15 [Candidatus Tectomicrobia bacterium RIFCSPLOWO2_02_FULL_70_19]OGL63888.1 MAG: peptidase S15 [Candidatus Tectomicrobia bacterium RIFCSPLOWO2_12_FULL_69_37]